MDKMAILFAQRVNLGTTKFAQIPKSLQPLVLQILKENDVEHLTEI